MTENKWVYVADRWPEPNVPVLVTCSGPLFGTAVTVGATDLCGVWQIYPINTVGRTEVIAWKPLPEPATPKGGTYEQE